MQERFRAGRRVVVAVAALATVLPALVAPPAGAAVPDSDPRPSRGTSVYESMPTDPTAVVLGSEDFPVHGDGVGDDTASIQAAIDEASRRGGENWLGNIVGGARGVEVGDGGGTVFVPEGTYRVTGRIKVHASVRLVGFGESRPEFYVPPATPAFGDAESVEYVFAAVRRPYVPGSPVTFGNNDTFATGLVNVDIRIGADNPGAVGVRFGGAQMFVLQDVDIDVGAGYAGIDHNANLIQRVNVRGGQFGLLAFAASPGWQTTVIDSTFTGQSAAGIRLHTDSKLSIIRTRFSDLPLGIEATPGQTQRLYLQNSLFERVTGPAITLNDSESVPAPDEPQLVRAQNQLNVVNTGVVDTGALLRTVPSGSTWMVPTPSYLVRDATLGLRVTDALGARVTRTDSVLVDAQPRSAASLKSLLTTDIPLPPPTHTWVNIADYAAEHGISVGAGGDDLAIFQRALDEHDTVYVPMGKYLLSDTLELRPQNSLIGLHPRQTWLAIPDKAPGYDDPNEPRAIVHTPEGGANIVSGLGLDTSRTNPGAVQVHWQSGRHSLLSDVTTQFVKWAPEHTQPGDPGVGDPGYDYRGKTRYNFWIDGGGGTFVNLWAVSGWADNGLLIENTAVEGRIYEVSVEHHQHREVVMRNFRGWEFHALQTEDHIYGWESQAVELDHVRDVLFGNTVFFRVATVLGPYPYAIGISDSTNVVIRGTRGYRPTNIENTRWGATVRDVGTGSEVPELEVAYLSVATPGRDANPSSVVSSTVDPHSLPVMPGETATTDLVLANHAGPVHDVSIAISAPDGLEVAAETPPQVLEGETRIPVSVTVNASTPLGATFDARIVVFFTFRGRPLAIEQTVRVRVGGENLAVGATVSSSSVLSTNVAANAVDGRVTGSRWVSAPADPAPTLTIDLGQPADLSRVVVYSGVTGSDALRVHTFEVDGRVDGVWQVLGRIEGNTADPVALPLQDAHAVSQVRLRFTRPSEADGIARVFEVEVYGTR